MASVTLDSEAAFKERALKIGLSQDNVDALLVAGFKTFGAVAFAVSATPNAASEDEVKQWIRSVFGSLPSAHHLACVRRLHFEAQSLSISDMKTRVEPSFDAAAKKMPVAERLVRQKAQEVPSKGDDALSRGCGQAGGCPFLLGFWEVRLPSPGNPIGQGREVHLH